MKFICSNFAEHKLYYLRNRKVALYHSFDM